MTSAIETALTQQAAIDGAKELKKLFSESASKINDLKQILQGVELQSQSLDDESVAYIKARIGVIVNGDIAENVYGLRQLVAAADAFLAG